MSEEAQVVNMLVRISRLAAARWGLTLEQVMQVFAPTDALGYVARNFALLHMEGDDAVLDDVEEYLAARGVSPHATA
ncbi:MAG: DUF3791 domain-containing protein [Coriobacteriales bacterium]|nr:DUF3791 domain-containing protein [Coriobacteriales bacterium]